MEKTRMYASKTTRSGRRIERIRTRDERTNGDERTKSLRRFRRAGKKMNLEEMMNQNEKRLRYDVSDSFQKHKHRVERDAVDQRLTNSHRDEHRISTLPHLGVDLGDDQSGAQQQERQHVVHETLEQNRGREGLEERNDEGGRHGDGDAIDGLHVLNAGVLVASYGGDPLVDEQERRVPERGARESRRGAGEHEDRGRPGEA